MNRITAILCLLLLCQSLWSASPVFQVMTSQGKEVSATLSAWEKGKPPLFRRLDQDQPEPIEFLYARVAGENLPRLPQENALWLDQGDCLSFSKIQVREEQVLLRPLDVLDADGKELAVPLLEARLIWWRNPLKETQPVAFREKLLQLPASKDVAILSNGEKAEGILESLDSDTLVLDGGDSRGRFKSQQLSVLALAAEKQANWQSSGKGMVLTTISGDRITLVQPVLKDDAVEGATTFGKAVRIPLGKVRKITNYQTKAMPIQNIPALSMEVNPWFSQKLVQKVNAGRVGGEFLLGEDAYESGLAMPGNAGLIIPTQGKYRGLALTVGMEAGIAGNPSAALRVVADGRVIAGPLEVAKGNSRRVFVDVAAVKEIRVVNLAGPGARLAIVDAFLLP